MPRKARSISATGIYHVTVCSVNGRKIFYYPQDYLKFKEILKYESEKYQVEIYGYCILDNHVHLLLYDVANKLSVMMKNLSYQYAKWYNKSYCSSGHVFASRFTSFCLENRMDILDCLVYIHLVPEYLGVTKRPTRYIYSSYREYINHSEIVNVSYILNLISKDLFPSIHKYSKYKMPVSPMKRCTDNVIRHRIAEIMKINKGEEICYLSPELYEVPLKRLLYEGVSIRQLARVTGLSGYSIKKINLCNSTKI